MIAPELPPERKIDESNADAKRMLRTGVLKSDIEMKAQSKLIGLVTHTQMMERFMKMMPMNPEQQKEYAEYMRTQGAPTTETVTGKISVEQAPFAAKPNLPISYGFMLGGLRLSVDRAGTVTEPLAEHRKGFPQGASISAFLSIMLLSMVHPPRGVKLLMYADDGLLYSNEKFDPIEFEKELDSLGLKLAHNKCR